jgi:elongation factor Ts
MAITASLVKELRERTGAGMMECKKALVETDGDLEKAVELMRKSGAAKADKKAGRVAAEGIVAAAISADRKIGALVEVNSETDFVAKEENFIAFANAVAQCVLDNAPADVDALLGMQLPGFDGDSVDEARRHLIAKIGENLNVRRFVRLESSDGHIGQYLHGKRIGVLVEMTGGDADLARDIAMHIAASRPVCVSEADVPAERVRKEKEIFVAQAEKSGKPPEIVEKMVGGQVKKFLKEITLLGQPYVKDPDQSVEKLLAANSAAVSGFSRIEVGEGIEKKVDNFAEEVMAQAGAGA